MTVHTRRAQITDAAAIAVVLADAFREFEALYTAAAYRATTPGPDEIAARWDEGPEWVACDDLGVVGTVGAVDRGESVYVRSMAVLPRARGQGVAAGLLAAVEGHARARGAARLTLSTTPFLTSAISLYERAGFHRDSGVLDLHGTELWGMTKELAAS